MWSVGSNLYNLGVFFSFAYAFRNIQIFVAVSQTGKVISGVSPKIIHLNLGKSTACY